MTELSTLITSLAPEDHIVNGSEGETSRLKSCGKETFLVHAKVVNEQGDDVGSGEVGEIVVRSGGMMKGYWNKPGPTSEVIKNGWLHTGDLAWMDKDRYFYIVDRKKLHTGFRK